MHPLAVLGFRLLICLRINSLFAWVCLFLLAHWLAYLLVFRLLVCLPIGCILLLALVWIFFFCCLLISSLIYVMFTYAVLPFCLLLNAHLLVFTCSVDFCSQLACFSFAFACFRMIVAWPHFFSNEHLLIRLLISLVPPRFRSTHLLTHLLDPACLFICFWLLSRESSFVCLACLYMCIHLPLPAFTCL